MHRVHRCEFCPTEYEPRPQVKNPRACPNAKCQQKRQGTNEKAWRERHTHLSGGEYHRVRRKQRRRKLEAIAVLILKCLEVGARFLNQRLDREGLSVFFTEFLSELGIRRANKLWRSDSDHNVAVLA